MENRNWSIRQGIVLFPSKTINSVAVNRVNMRKIYRNKREMLILLLEGKRAKKEAEVANRVEHCLNLISKTISKFFAQQQVYIGSYATQIANKRWTVKQINIFQRMLSSAPLQQLQMNLKHEIQQEFQLLFGVTSLKIAGIKWDVDELVQHQQDVERQFAEYCKAILVAEYMTILANKVGEQCLSTLNCPPIFEKVAKKFKIGSIFISAVDCQPEEQILRYQREIKKYLTGAMTNIENRINQDMRAITAKAFYDLYDQTMASCFEKKLALLVARDNNQVAQKQKKNGISIKAS